MATAGRLLPAVLISASLAAAFACVRYADTDSTDSAVETVVYTSLRPPNWDLWLFEEPEGPPRRLTDHPALDYNAVFSPDGRWVVFPVDRYGERVVWKL